jgi:hypothetical protein
LEPIPARKLITLTSLSPGNPGVTGKLVLRFPSKGREASNI